MSFYVPSLATATVCLVLPDLVRGLKKQAEKGVYSKNRYTPFSNEYTQHPLPKQAVKAVDFSTAG